MLKNFDDLSIDWLDCLVDRNVTGDEGWVVWGKDGNFSLQLEPGYGIAVPLPYDTEDPKTVFCDYWLISVWHDPEFFDLNILWEYCEPSFIAFCNWVYRQWFEAGFCDAVPIWQASS